MKYRIVECDNGKSQWYEVYYRYLFMWFPVNTISPGGCAPNPRIFSTKEQAEHWVSLRISTTDKLVQQPPVERRVVSEYDN